MGHRRSGEDARAWDQLDLLPPDEGVGARQLGVSPGGRGGGYLNERTPSEDDHLDSRNFAKIVEGYSKTLDPREAALVAELDVMGMPRWWLQIAQTIGFDNTLEVWRILDAQREMQTDDGLMINLRMRPFSSYERFQRNRFIEALGAMGFSMHEIRQKVKKELGEDLSERHTWRLSMPGRVPK